MGEEETSRDTRALWEVEEGSEHQEHGGKEAPLGTGRRHIATRFLGVDQRDRAAVDLGIK